MQSVIGETSPCPTIRQSTKVLFIAVDENVSQNCCARPFLRAILCPLAQQSYFSSGRLLPPTRLPLERSPASNALMP